MIDKSENRPSPEALLEQAKRDARGKLKIFLGAAPGVGKTFSMLRAAQARRKENVDVVIGIVETHQRSETNAMMEGLEAIPRLTLEYRGIGFQEMDIDAILLRKPKLVLVDELAHSNIPGARHPKRYQDVVELLDSGIDVYSTLNVQHIESLNDIVARITGVTVRETIPDSILQQADSIELIDLTPDELLQRLKEGKVYIPEQARLAMNRFFTPGNLTALRELALRQAAARVDDQMTSYMRSHAIGPWPTSDRVMVCLSDDGQAMQLVRTAKRSADRRRAPWLALYIETHNHASMPEAARREIAQALHLAENLGGEQLTVAGEDVVAEVLRVAGDRNVSVIIIGKSQRSFLSHILRPSVGNALLKQGGNFDITVMSAVGDTARKRSEIAEGLSRLWGRSLPWRAYGEALLVMLGTTVFASLLGHMANLSTLSMVFLISVFLVAVDRGIRVSLFASLLGVASLDFFFTVPRHSFSVTRNEDFIALAYFLVVAVAISLVGDRLQRQVEVTRRNAERTHALYDFNRTLAAASALDDIQAAIVRHVGQSLKARAVLMAPIDGRLDYVASFPDNTRLDTASAAAMNWAWTHGRPAGLHSDTLPGAAFYGVPLRMGDDTMGVLAIRPEEGHRLTPDQEMFFSSLANQSAIALGRARLATDISQARLQTETERLRSSLLSSISHDLRTPLVSVLGTTTTLRDYWGKLDDEARLEMFGTIEEEADRLNRFVQNLLDMSALVTGGLNLKREPVGVQDVVGTALGKLRKQLGDRPLRLDIAADLPDMNGDFSILERVLINIIDNACKYAPADQPITISARRETHYVRLTVTDRGPGIPEEERDRVFDMFYRVKVGSAPTSGAGLGLAICRGFIEAHGGRISAQSGPDGIGTQIAVRVPVVEAA